MIINLIKVMDHFLLLLVAFSLTCAVNAASSCPCSSLDLCNVVTKQHSKELVAFSGATDGSWKKWNWTEITNVVYYGTLDKYQDLYCYAHQRQVRFTLLVGVPVTSFTKLSQPDFRKQVMAEWISKVQNYSLDGINIDIEGSAFTKDVIQGITDLSNETYIALKSMNKNYLITWDVGYSPYLLGCVLGYCYDYVSLSKCTDYFIVMDYDASLDILIASANSPYNLIKESLNLYIQNLSINPNHLVMAIPWYGYDYTCGKFYNASGDNLCVIAGSPNEQINYAAIEKLYLQNIGGLKWDPKAASPFFTTQPDGVYHQFWFDNVESLKVKYQLALSLKLRGLGMWQADCLDYISNDPKIMDETQQMWDTITVYLKMLQIS